ncbi:beta-lactamase family protein [bacterium]|nr:beta-lactamase family protein [bacterium]
MHHRHQSLNTFLVLSLFATFASVTGAEPDNQRAQVGAFQRKIINDEITGSNLVIIGSKNGTQTVSIVNSDRDGDRDVDETTIFPIWSMSKPITIVAMMTLSEQGKFDWNDPVSKYLPCFTNLQVQHDDGVRPATVPLTIEHLMSHRSGWTYYSGWENGVPKKNSLQNPVPPGFHRPHPNQTRFNDLQSFCELIAKEPLHFEPGSEFIYGVNQAILGRLVEVLSGMPFEKYLSEAIFEPLKMTDTSFVMDEAKRARFQPLWINAENLKGYTFLLDEMTYSSESKAHFGGEGLVSTASDYSKFCQMLLSGGTFNGQRILSQASLDRMTTPLSEDIMTDAGQAAGMDMGYSVFVMRDASAEGNAAPKGIFGWSGYHNTHFWIDPSNEMYVLWMSRAREFNFEIPQGLRKVIYGPAK